MKYKNFIIIVIVLIILVGAGLALTRGDEDSWICVNGQWVEHGHPSGPKPSALLCQLAEEAAVNNFDQCAAAGNLIMESYPRQCRTPQGETFTEEIGNELEKTDLIKIDNPRPNQIIQSPLEISGQARGNWYFEASFPVKLMDGNNNEIAIGIAQAQSDWMTKEFVPYQAEISFEAPIGAESGWLVLEKDNPSGLPENADELRLPVNFGPAIEMMTVKVYFSNSEMDPETSCDKVFPVEREVGKTEAAARAALTELLKGTLPSEEEQGFFTSLNPGVAIQSLTIENGIARVDFDEQMEYQLGGSCRVSAIRAQITETLKQFPTVNEVVISVEGRTEDILQP